MPRYIAILFALPLLLSCNESAEAKPLAKNFVEPAKSLEEQFDDLYKLLNEYFLPISLSPKEGYPRSPEGAIEFTKMPKSLIPIFKFFTDSYDKNFRYRKLAIAIHLFFTLLFIYAVTIEVKNM